MGLKGFGGLGLVVFIVSKHEIVLSFTDDPLVLLLVLKLLTDLYHTLGEEDWDLVVPVDLLAVLNVLLGRKRSVTPRVTKPLPDVLLVGRTSLSLFRNLIHPSRTRM